MRIRMPVLAAAAAFLCSSAAFGDGIVTPEIARVKRMTLLVTGSGTKPCDFDIERLRTDAKFILNAGNVEFRDFAATDNPIEFMSAPVLQIAASSYDARAACALAVSVELNAWVFKGEVLGKATDNIQTTIWSQRQVGIAAGNNLTATASDGIQTAIKALANDLAESRRKFPQDAANAP